MADRPSRMKFVKREEEYLGVETLPLMVSHMSHRKTFTPFPYRKEFQTIFLGKAIHDVIERDGVGDSILLCCLHLKGIPNPVEDTCIS